MKTYSKIVIGLFLLVFISCTKETSKVIPTLTATAVTNITATSATAGGEVTSDGGAAVTARGVCWSLTNSAPTILDSKTEDGSGLGIFTSSMTGLTPGTTYNIRAYATNSVGTAYYSQVQFKTLITSPSVTTATDISAITYSTCKSGGNVTSDGGSSGTSRGVCWSTNQSPTITDNKTSDGTGTGNFASSVIGLNPGTKYYLRSYATNNFKTVYGNEVSFTTTSAGTVTDVVGNVYITVIIGSQKWMASNLRTTKYNDGTAIPPFAAILTTNFPTTPGFGWFSTAEQTNQNPNGAIYNWYVVNTGKLCPTGWHVPSDGEWHTLIQYIDSNALLNANGAESTTAGGKLREAFTYHWSDPTGATNDTGFTAVGAGSLVYGTIQTGVYMLSAGSSAYYWSATEFNVSNAYLRVLDDGRSYVSRLDYQKSAGMSVRCLKD